METIAYFIGAMFAVIDGMYQVYCDAALYFMKNDSHGFMLAMWAVFMFTFLMMLVGMFTSVRGVYRCVRG